MPDLLLKRVAPLSDATFGVLIGPGGVPFAVTCERPWLNNKPRESCIPAGTYQCKRVDSQKLGNTFEVLNVPNRSAILFHGGNVAADSLGCILVGHGFDPVKGTAGIVQSQKEFGEFLKLQHGTDAFTLHIVNV